MGKTTIALAAACAWILGCSNGPATVDGGTEAGGPDASDAAPDAPPGLDAGDAGDAGDGGAACGTKLRATAPYSIAANTVATECWSFDVSASQKEHIVSIRPALDKTSVVRSILVYHPSAASSYTGTPSTCEALLQPPAPLVYVWQPGAASSFDLPPEAGFPIESGVAHFVVAVTYDNLGASAQSDSSGVDLCTTTALRANDADVVAFGTTKISIPPNGMNAVAGCTGTLDSSYDGMHVFALLPHANAYATSMSLGQMQTTLVQGAYDWTNQPWVSASATLHTNDTMTTSCTYDNTTSSTITLGWTGGETCFVFAAYWPKKTFAQAWAQPLTLSGCF